MNWYDKAIERVSLDSELLKHSELLLGYPCLDSEHYKWVATASKGEILDWCVCIVDS